MTEPTKPTRPTTALIVVPADGDTWTEITGCQVLEVPLAQLSASTSLSELSVLRR